MYSHSRLLLTFLLATLSTSSVAMMEFPFCPSGGPQGWMNYFEHRHNKNLWRQYNSAQQNRRYIPENYSPSYGYGYSGYPGYNTTYQPGAAPFYIEPLYNSPNYNAIQQQATTPNSH